VEFRRVHFTGKRDGFIDGIEAVAVDFGGGFEVFLSLLRHGYSTSMPMERAVPSTIFIACSTVFALRSGIFVSAILRMSATFTLPTLLRRFAPLPLAIPAAWRSRSAAGGVRRTNVKERSSKMVSW